ncbi:hypothetical protein AGMMS50284_2540 [Clostridia bacterium]|nr:hypothetical protein AGMMS50284_2510 [Clostridia bacterium]GHU81826.1 hypothetical protein AGMMS50284_2540 [Clostridia bacterium]
MAVLVAIATTDGKTVHQHFGRAEKFHIVSLTKDGYSYVEERKTEPCCHNFEHEDTAFDAVYRELKDCKAIIVGKIGYVAAEFLIARGMRVFETPGLVDDILNEIIKQKLLF